MTKYERARVLGTRALQIRCVQMSLAFKLKNLDLRLLHGAETSDVRDEADTKVGAV